MLNFILLMGLTNMLGGRWVDVYGAPTSGGRLIFRCILPGLCAGALAFDQGHGLILSTYAWAAVTAGSALWFSFGWSFDELDGGYDAAKYPRWIQRLGAYFFPPDEKPRTNKKRGVFTKGLRGLFDILTFSLLSYIHPVALLLFPFCAAQGIIYWLVGQIAPTQQRVLFGELFHGMWRGLLIGIVLVS